MIPQRYEYYNANIEPRSDGRLLFFADAEKWVGEEVATLTEALANQRRRIGAEYDDLMGKLKTIQSNALAEIAKKDEEIRKLSARIQKDSRPCPPCEHLDEKIKEIATLKEKIKEQDEAVYCPTCGACGEEGCCPLDRCEHLKCFYGEHYAKTYRDLEAENETLRTLVDGASDIVEIYPTESPAQKEWRDNWLAKARETLK